MITLKQQAKYIGHDRWEWSVWLDGKPAELAQVEKVVYTLHPTFPLPVIEVKDRRTGFRLDSGGWGEFEIYAESHLKNGKTKKLKHYLHLEYPETGAPAKAKRAAAKEAPRKPVVFVSSGIADAHLAQSLQKSLAGQGLQVITSDDLSAGESWGKSIDSALSNANVAAFLISSHTSPFVSREIAAAISKGNRKIVPVLVGAGAELPAQLSKYQPIRMDNPADLGAIARSVGELASADLSAFGKKSRSRS
jgi:hypothetical protein